MYYKQIFENQDLYRENFRFLMKKFPHILPYLEEDVKHPRFQLYGSIEKKTLNLYLSHIKYYQSNAYRYAKDRTKEQHIHNLFHFRSLYPYRSPYDTAYTGFINLIDELHEIPKNFWYSQTCMNNKFSKKHIIPWGFVYGIGLGIHIPLLIKKKHVKHLIVFDHDPVFLRASMHVISWEHDIFNPLKKRHGELHIFLGLAAYYTIGNIHQENALRDLYERIQNFIYTHPHAPIQQGSFFHCHIHDPVTEKTIHREIFYIASRAIGLHGSDLDEYVMNTNTYANIVDLKSTCIVRKKKQPLPQIKMPIFIIGSAPSLTQYLSFIKKHQNQVILMVCGSAIAPILQAGIQPDFYLQLENVSYVSMTTFLLLGKHKIPQETYAMFMNSVPNLARNGFRSIIIMPRQTNSGHLFSKITQQGFPSIGAQSVVPMALDIAQYFKPTYIALFGVDLSILEKNTSHIDGTLFYESNPWKHAFVDTEYHVSKKIRTLYGKPAFTNLILEDIKKNLESLIIQHLTENPDMTIFNCSHGLSILGTRAIHPDLLPMNKQKNKSLYIQEVVQQLSLTHKHTEKLRSILKQAEQKAHLTCTQIHQMIQNVKHFDELYLLPFTLAEKASLYDDNIFGTSIHLNIDFCCLFLHTYLDMIPLKAKKTFLKAIKKHFSQNINMTYSMIKTVTNRYKKQVYNN